MGIDPPRVMTSEIAQEFMMANRRRELSPNTIEYYQWCLDKLVSACPEWPASAGEIAAAWDSPKLGRVSRGNVERGIRIFLAWAQNNHGYPNVLHGSKRMPKAKTLPRVLHEEEVVAVWDACETAQERAMIALLLDTGIRLGELAALRWADVGHGSLNVNGKTGPRVVPVSPSIQEMLTGLGDAEHIWVSRNGPMSRSAVQMVINRVFQRSGLQGPKLGAHILRHTFATNYIADGGSVAHLQRILGHANISTTVIYLHLSVRALQADHRAHSPARRMLAQSGIRRDEERFPDS